MQKLCNLLNILFSKVCGISSNFGIIEYFLLERLSDVFEICEINLNYSFDANEFSPPLLKRFQLSHAFSRGLHLG